MLKIHRVLLENFCQHEYLDIPFHDGLTVVLGPNGSGKSNFLNGIYGAFTGDFGRGPGSIAECIRKDGEAGGSVQAIGSVDGREFRLRRDLRVASDGKAKVDHALWLDGDKRKACKTEREIESWLTGVSGLTPEIMAEFLFLEQEALFGFLKRNDSERSRKFSALCGTKPYDQIREKFAFFVKEDRIRYESSKATAEYCRRTLETAQKNRSDLEGQLASLRRTCEVDDIPAHLRDLESQWRSATETLFERREQETTLERLARDKASVSDRLTQCVRIRDELSRAVLDLTEERNRLTSRQEDLESRLADMLDGASLPETVDLLNASLQANGKRESLQRKIEDSRNRLESMPAARPVDPREYSQREKEHGHVTRRIGELDANLQFVRTMISVLTPLPLTGRNDCDCPLCGADSAAWKVDPRKLEASEKDLVREKEECDRRREELKRHMSALEKAREQYELDLQKRAELSDWLTRFETELAACPAHDADAANRLTALTEQDRSLHETVQAVTAVTQRIARESALLREKRIEEETLRSEETRIDREIEELDADTPEVRLARLEATRVEIVSLESRLAEWHECERRMTALEGAVREAVRLTELAQSELDGQRALEPESDHIALWFEKCDKAVDWLKKDGLPRLVHRTVMQELARAVNDELGRFKDPFRVKVNDDVSLTAIFETGKEIKSKALSGGEKYMLGIAFMAAVNRTFARNLGIMFLDEPTASLDALHIQLLFQSLRQWKQVLHRRNEQLIIVTHVEEMARIADTVIRFGSEEMEYGTNRSLHRVLSS